MTLPIVFHPDYLAPLRPGHPFPMSKYGYLREALVARRLLPPAGGFVVARRRSASPAPPPSTPSPTSSGWRTRPSPPPRPARSACPTPPPSPAAPSSPPAGTLLAARLALEHGLACNMAGGSHHAGPEGGAGYCVFNDVAVAAQALLDEGRVARVLVVDCDVHQGDGTARIFAGRPDVLTLSLHAERNYPARKAASRPRLPAARPPRRPRLPRGPRPRAGRRRALPPRPRLLQRRRRPARRRPPRPARAHRRRASAPATPSCSPGRAAAACRSPASSAAATTTTPSASPPATPSSSRKPPARWRPEAVGHHEARLHKLLQRGYLIGAKRYSDRH